MSAGSLVASGIGVFLLIVTAYVLIGGTLATTEVMVEAQGNLAAYQEARMRTAIEIQNVAIINNETLNVEVKNIGGESITAVPLMDVYINDGSLPRYVPYGQGDGICWNAIEIAPDDIHPGQLDPGETLYIEIISSDEQIESTWIQVVTPNGVRSSTYIGK